MSICSAIERAAAAERALEAALHEAGDRHRADHDVYHLTRSRAQQARANVERLGGVSERHGARVEETEPAPEPPASEGADPLLADLERLHLCGSRASLVWTALAQAAQAARDDELLGVASECHAETLRTLRWTVQKTKEAAPQALTAG